MALTRTIQPSSFCYRLLPWHIASKYITFIQLIPHLIFSF